MAEPVDPFEGGQLSMIRQGHRRRISSVLYRRWWTPPGHCPSPSTTPGLTDEQRIVRVTHPFHPCSGREFAFVEVRRTWNQDRVFFFDDDGVLRSLPTEWTDAGDPDVFLAVAAGRSPFRVEDLLTLTELIAGLGSHADGSGV